MVRVHIFVKHIRLGPISSGDFKKNEHVEDHKENNKSKVGSSVLVGNCPQLCFVGLPCCVPSCLRHKVDHHRTGGGRDFPLLQTSSSFSTPSSCLGHTQDLHHTPPWTEFSSPERHHLTKIHVDAPCWSPPLEYCRTTRQKQGWPEAAGSGWIRTLSSCRAQWHWGWDQAPIYTTFPLVLKQSPFLDGKT